MGTGLTITPELRSYVDKQKKKVEKFVHDSSARLDIEFERLTERNTGNEFRAELMVRGGGLDIRSESSASTLHGAIDDAVEQLLVELRKIKGKKLRLFKLGGLKLKNWMRFGRDKNV